MHRRTVLALLGASSAALGGCGALGSSTPTERATRTPPTCESPGPRRVELAGTADVPDEAGFSVTASMERSRPTADQPVRLAVVFRNDGPERAIAAPDDSRCYPFNRSRSLSDPRGLQLHHEDGREKSRVEPCWTRDAPPKRRNPGWDGYGCEQVSIASGDSVTYSIEVWDDFRIDGYMPPGTYRFTTRTIDRQADERYEWWIELEVTEPER